MSKQTFIRRYSLILRRLEIGRATYEQIKEYLEKESDILGRDYSISQRSLQRDIKDIHEQFNIEIENEKRGEKRYYIKSRPETEGPGLRLLESYQMTSIIKASQDFANYVFLETRKPDGLEHFYGLLHAIKNKKIIRFKYKKFYNDEVSERKLYPLALKEAKNRWYLIAEDTKDNQVKTFGLDRISELDITKLTFKKNDQINYETLFKDCFGIINPANQKPEKIKLSFTYMQGQYIKAFPLHTMQNVIKESKEEDKVLVELNLLITDDFIMELLSFGSDVEVISPKQLRDEVKKNLIKTLKYYSK